MPAGGAQRLPNVTLTECSDLHNSKNDSMERGMSDNQRRFFCRLLFLFFCCLPTALIVYRACHPRTPEFWQRTIQSQLGIDTQIADAETPKPGQTILRGLTLFGNDGTPILFAIETRFDEQLNRITINERLRLTGRGLTELANSLNQRLVGSGVWSIRLEDVEVINDSTDEAGQGVYLSQVEIAIAPEVSGPGGRPSARAELSMQFSDGSLESESTLAAKVPRVQCTFHCLEDPLLTKVFVETGEQSVPCWLGAGWLPQLAELGPRATFIGSFGVDPVSETNIGRVEGRFEQVALTEEYASAPIAGSTVERRTQLKSGLGSMKVDMIFDDNSRHKLAAGQPLEIEATLELPDGSQHPVVPEYHFQQVLNVGSAIRKTVRTARSRSASTNY